jgi:hypothetical protein
MRPKRLASGGKRYTRGCARGKAQWIYDAGADVIWLDRDEVNRLWGKKLGLPASER